MKPYVILIFTVLLSACGLQQKLSASHKLSPGMAKAEVEKIMGAPAKSDFRNNVEEWHYCRTGMEADEFLALFFYDGKLIEKLNYTVTLADAKATGSCEKFIKMGNYREPDRVIEIRMR